MVEQVKPLDTRQIWDAHVSDYFEAEDITNEEVNFPALMRVVGDMRGLTVLDFGCGNGRFTSRLEDIGASRVIGVDISPAMIELARAQHAKSQTEYYVVPDNTLSFLPDQAVDKTMANLVFMMSSSRQAILASMREIHRILKPNGSFTFLITHPSFIERGAFDYRNEFDGPFNYMLEEKPYKFILKDSNGNDIDGDFYDYQYTVCTYVNIAIKAGFRLSYMEEVTYPEDVARRHQIPPEYLRFPQALIIQGLKQ